MTKNEPIVVHIDVDKKRAELPEYEQGSLCPDCRTPTTDGFGLAGGGFGVYTYCEQCGKVTSKTETDE